MSGLDLRLEGVRKAYERPVLDGVDLAVAAGRILVVLGSSGAGKTTLLRIVAGLEAADAGRVVLGDRVLSDPRVLVPPARRGVGLVFQHLELWPHMTVAENVAFGLPGRPRGRDALRHPVVRDLAERVGVASLLDRTPPTLSGGERQRVAIARTLAPSPHVILDDEPLANLDPARRADLRGLIRRLCREGATTLVHVTHDAEEAMEMGDEVAVLHGGRVVEHGAPDDLYRAPRTLAGARALGAVNVLEARVGEGAVHTALGALEPAGEALGPGPALALLRPESVRAAPGEEAEVVEAWPRGANWAFLARRGETEVEGRSDRPLGKGQRVRLEVVGPARLLPPEAGS